MLVKAEYGKTRQKLHAGALHSFFWLPPHTPEGRCASFLLLFWRTLKIRGKQQKRWCFNAKTALKKEQSPKFSQCCENYIANFSPPTLYYSVWYNHILYTVINQKHLEAFHKHLVRPHKRNSSFPSFQTKETHRHGPDPRQCRISARTCAFIAALPGTHLSGLPLRAQKPLTIYI